MKDKFEMGMEEISGAIFLMIPVEHLVINSIAAVVSTVSSIKAVLDTSILTEEGSLTDESKELLHGRNQSLFLLKTACAYDNILIY